MENNANIDQVLAGLKNELTVFEKEALRDKLIFYINYLLLNDFNQLVQLLYRVDVDETKIKACLAENPGKDAAILIADMLIARQVQKQKDRDSFTQREQPPEDEKW